MKYLTAEETEIIRKIKFNNGSNIKDKGPSFFNLMYPDQPFYNLTKLLPDGGWELHGSALSGEHWHFDDLVSAATFLQLTGKLTGKIE